MAGEIPSSSQMRIDRKLFATRLQAFKEEPDQQTQHNFGFGMKVLENSTTKTHPILLSFKNVGEICIPISKDDSQRLKAVSQSICNGLWEMDLQFFPLVIENPHVAKYLDVTIPMMTELTLRHFQLSKAKLEGFHVRPHKLTITEPGTGLIVQQPINDSSGVFATMTVQLPLQGGHKGGLIKIARGKLTRTFANDLESSLLFYYTAFMSNCTFQMAELSSGSIVAITFHLVCSNPPSSTLTPTYLKDVASILLDFSPTGPDRLFAIPLDSNEVSFASLSPGNRRLVSLFASMNFLDIRLAVVCHSRVGKMNQRNGCPCCVQRKCPCENVVMHQICEEKISTVKWLDTSDKDMQFENLNVNTRTEIVGDDPVFFEKPTQEIIDPQTGLLHQWFNRPMLVIWHKERSGQIDCLHRFDILLKNLELGASLHSLDEIVRFCKEFPEMAWKNDGTSSQLLKLCLKLKANKQTIEVLELLSLTEGIRNESTADVLAEVVKSIGWDVCSASILQFVSRSRSREQMRYYVRFNSALLNAGCRKAAVLIASQICTFLFTDNLMTSLEIAVVALCIELMITLDENPSTKDPQRLCHLSVLIKQNLSSFLTILQLLILVQQYLDARPAERIPNTAIEWFSNVCLYLTGLVIPTGTRPDIIISALNLFVSIGDSAIMKAFKFQLSSQEYQANGIMSSLIADEGFWNFALVSSENKSAVASLVDKRIQWLITVPKPKATWRIPNATVVDHPMVENFMRSNESLMIYQNFNNIQHARNWRRKHEHELCPYANLEVGGAGRTAFCHIQKTKQHYIGDDKKYAICHRELMNLIDRRLARLGDTIFSVIKNQATNEISSVELVQDLANQTISMPVESVVAPNPISQPVVLNREGVHAVTVLSNVQRIINEIAVGKSKTAAVKRKANLPKVVAVSNPVVEKAAQESAVIHPANVLSVLQVNQQPVYAFQQSPVDSKSSTTVQTLLPSSNPSPKTTPRRVGVAKRPLVLSSFSQIINNPSLAPNNPAIDVKEESAAKKAKLEIA